MAEAVLFSDSTVFRGKRLHLAVTGSVGCYRACDLLRLLLHAGCSVSAALSQGALAFLNPRLFVALGAYPVASELFSEEPFAHLEPGQNAHAMLVAPASADMLAKLSYGLADDIVAAQALAFAGPLLVAPAMNPRMWAHPAVRENLAKLRERGVRVVEPARGTCACGEEGQGKLAAIDDLFLESLRACAPKDMVGKRALVTLGPTREFWDGVRYWSNPSTGRMGAACALALWMRGARVTAICGPGVQYQLPCDITRVDVVSAEEMASASQEFWGSADFGIFSAAVADFAPRRVDSTMKCKKTTLPEEFSVAFLKNPDILLQAVAARGSAQKIVAFAAETTKDQAELCVRAREKLARKGADLLAANRVNESGSGFGTSTNRMVLVDAKGREECLELQSKADVAWRIASWLLDL